MKSLNALVLAVSLTAVSTVTQAADVYSCTAKLELGYFNVETVNLVTNEIVSQGLLSTFNSKAVDVEVSDDFFSEGVLIPVRTAVGDETQQVFVDVKIMDYKAMAGSTEELKLLYHAKSLLPDLDKVYGSVSAEYGARKISGWSKGMLPKVGKAPNQSSVSVTCLKK